MGGSLPDPLGLHDRDGLGLPDPAAAMQGSRESWRVEHAGDLPAAPPAPNPETNKETAEAIEAAAREERRKSRGGRASTILSGGTGVTGSPSLASKQLTGE